MNSKREMKKRRIILCVLWIASLVIISFYGGPVSYGFFFSVTLLPLLSLIYVALVFFFFKTYQKLENRNVVCGQPVPYLFILRNEGFYPFSGIKIRLFSFFSYVEQMDEDTEYELLYGDEYMYKTNLVCKYRGEYEVGIKDIEVTDFLRLFSLRYKVKSTLSVVVQPKVTELSGLASIEDIPGIQQKEFMQADTEPDVLTRDYIEGDPLRRISWKQSAREQKLKVRKRVGEEKQGIVLLGDNGRYSDRMREYLPLESKMLEIIASLGLFMAKNNMIFSAHFGQGNQGMYRVEGVKDFDTFYRVVSAVRFREENRLQTTVDELFRDGLLQRSKLVIGVFHEINDEMMHMAVRLSDAGTAVVWYVVTDEDCTRYEEQSNERRKIIVIPVESQLEGTL